MIARKIIRFAIFLLYFKLISSLRSILPHHFLSSSNHLQIKQHPLILKMPLQRLFIPHLQMIDMIDLFLKVTFPHGQVFALPSVELHPTPVANTILGAGRHLSTLRFLLRLGLGLVVQCCHFLLQKLQFRLKCFFSFGQLPFRGVFGIKRKTLWVGEVIMDIIEQILTLSVLGIPLGDYFGLWSFLSGCQFFLELVHLLLQTVGKPTLGS